MDLWKLLADMVVLLIACLVGGGLASRFKQSPLVGYLVGGMLIGGPGSLGFVSAQKEIEAIAELGVALLLFSLGLEFSIQRLKSLGATPLLGGAIQVGVTLGFGALVASCFGLDFRSSIALGALVALSSTAVVLRILMERSEMEMPHGRNALGVLLTQDMAVVPLALLMTVLGGEGTATEIAMDVGKLLLLAIGLTIGLFVLTKLAVLALGTLTLQRNRELTVVFATGMGLGSAWAAHWAGISPALGAFVAGMLLGSSQFAVQIRSDVSTLRVLLLTLFFGSAGMVADPIWIFWHAHWVAAAAVAVTVGKLLIISGIFLAFKQSFRVSVATGLALAQLGEFAFVLGTIGRSSGVVSNDAYSLIVSVTIVSFMLAAFVVPRAPALSDRIAQLLGKSHVDEKNKAEGEHHADVLVIGFGPTGRLATLSLRGAGLRVVVIDLNLKSVKSANECGFEGHVGDATSPEVLEHASIGTASLVIITIPHFESTLAITELVHSLNSSVAILARSRYHVHSDALKTAGAIVSDDEEQVGNAIGINVKTWLEKRSHSASAGGSTG